MTNLHTSICITPQATLVVQANKQLVARYYAGSMDGNIVSNQARSQWHLSHYMLGYSLRTGGLNEQQQLSNELYVYTSRTNSACIHSKCCGVSTYEISYQISTSHSLITNCLTHFIREEQWIVVRDLRQQEKNLILHVFHIFSKQYNV